LEELHQELGVTSLFVTHDQEEALELANEVIVMNHGRIEQAGSADEIYNRPAGPFVAAFVGSSNALRGPVRDGHVHFGDTALPAEGIRDGITGVIYVRAHDIVLSPEPSSSALSVRVDRRTELGWNTKIHLHLVDGQVLVAEVRKEDAAGIEVGSHLFASLRNAKVFPDGNEGSGNDGVVIERGSVKTTA